ncbi:hypothetical protein EPO05_01735 [Patescibacteria group bacterium]|nr:MAG: hypothetical protein EPO05_01735 [Patescibacteria group bacterium]
MEKSTLGKWLIFAGILLGIGVVAFALFGSGPKINWDQDIVYFYGDGCSHCEVLSKFLEDNKVAEKVPFQKLEVWKNLRNQKLLMEAVKRCQIDTSAGGVGVPFVYARGKCFVGEVEATDFFKAEAGLQ